MKAMKNCSSGLAVGALFLNPAWWLGSSTPEQEGHEGNEDHEELPGQRQQHVLEVRRRDLDAATPDKQLPLPFFMVFMLLHVLPVPAPGKPVAQRSPG